MFQRDGKRYCAISEDGFQIERSGSPLTQFVLHYIEGTHSLDYPLENLMPGSITKIDVESLGKWNQPFSSEIISDQKREQIAGRIVAALRFLGDKAEVSHGSED